MYLSEGWQEQPMPPLLTNRPQQAPTVSFLGSWCKRAKSRRRLRPCPSRRWMRTSTGGWRPGWDGASQGHEDSQRLHFACSINRESFRGLSYSLWSILGPLVLKLNGNPLRPGIYHGSTWRFLDRVNMDTKGLWQLQTPES